MLPPGLIEFAEPEVDGIFFAFSGPSLVTYQTIDEYVVVTDLVQAISRAISHVKAGKHDPMFAFETLKDVYSWGDVAERTERVYEEAIKTDQPPVVERLRRCALSLQTKIAVVIFSCSSMLTDSERSPSYYGTGRVFGIIMCVIVMVDYMWLAVLDWWSPRCRIELAPKFDLDKWRRVGFSPSSRSTSADTELACMPQVCAEEIEKIREPR